MLPAPPITIAAMFVISGALVRTGLLDALAALVIARAETRPKVAVAVYLTATLLASGIVNNTPVVLILIPVMIRLARSLGIAETRLLIPLSYAAVLGGTLPRHRSVDRLLDRVRVGASVGELLAEAAHLGARVLELSLIHI